MTIWIDMKNAHEPAFFKQMISYLIESKYNLVISCRGNTEVPDLLSDYIEDFKIIGKHSEKGMKEKLFFFVWRNIELLFNMIEFDVNLSFISANSIQVSKIRQKPVITFTDNDLMTYWNRLSLRFADFVIVPAAIPIDNLLRQGARPSSIIQFNGFKEDIYIADFAPSRYFMSQIPFEDYILIRPEALKSEYIYTKSGSLTYALIERLEQEEFNIVYLPRYRDDPIRTQKRPKVFVPLKPLNGLDLCWHARAVLSGSGTLSREAACMGKPAVSFYPGDNMLSVDKKMIDDGMLFHSRDETEIVKFLSGAKLRPIDMKRCRAVRDKVFDIVGDILATVT
jgi:predicted glycosyltransferase